jgi:hypothetical protein
MPGDPVKKPKPSATTRPRSVSNETPDTEPPLEAKDHYQREKARRARHAPPDSEAMASARREYQSMLETNAAKGRGGRPKKQAASPKTDEDVLDESAPEDE